MYIYKIEQDSYEFGCDDHLDITINVCNVSSLREAKEKVMNFLQDINIQKFLVLDSKPDEN